MVLPENIIPYISFRIIVFKRTMRLDMQETPKKTSFSLSKYLSKVEIFGWALCIFSMMTIVFAKQLSPETEPYENYYTE